MICAVECGILNRHALRNIAWLIVAVVAINAPFWFLGLFFFFDRCFITLDSIVVAVVMSVMPLLGVMLLIVTWAVDVLIVTSKIYFFSTPGSFLHASVFAENLNIFKLVSASTVGVGVLFIFFGVIAFRLCRNSKARFLSVVMVITFFLLMDVLNGSSRFSIRESNFIPVNIMGSSVYNLALNLKQVNSINPLRRLPNGESIKDAFDLPSWAQAHPTQSVLFVIVESYGIHRDESLRRWVKSRLLDDAILHKYNFIERNFPFDGSTTAGELRGLCGLAKDYRSADASVMSECLPAQFSRMGWETIGIHGFSHNMFDRQLWWPMMGLKKMLFAEELLLPQTSRCGSALRGACDADMIMRAGAELRPGVRFVYLLTLNTHLPLQQKLIPLELQDQCERAKTGTDVCLLLDGVGSVFERLNEILVTMSPRPAVVIIGDHAPPFSILSNRDQFDLKHVPGLILLPKD